MRVLVAHEKYRSSAPSGENGVFRDEVAALRQGGHTVDTLVVENDIIEEFSPLRRALVGLEVVWSPGGFSRVRKAIRQVRPDVVHFHNTFPLLSPAAYDACRAEGVPVVQTLHNYRTICPAGTLYRNEQICQDCVGAFPLPAVMHGCYRNSRIHSVPMAAMVWTHRLAATWRRKVDLFIALTPTQRNLLVEGGLPDERVALKPNLMHNPPAPRYDDDGYGIYLGRFSEEKGIWPMIDAMESLETVPLHIYGAGPIEAEMARRLEKVPNVHLGGRKPHAFCVERLRGARFLIQASTWHEPCPMTVREAFACGTPVVATRLGGLRDMVVDGQNGLHCDAGNPADLARAVQQIVTDDALHAKLARGARSTFDAQYAPDVGLHALVQCYERALTIHRDRNGAPRRAA